MKTKRLISILMALVIMLSVVFCAVPTASAKDKRYISNLKVETTPKVTYAAGIYGRNVGNSYKLHRGNSYFISNKFTINKKQLKDLSMFDLIASHKTTTSNKYSVSVDYPGSITVRSNAKINKKVKVTDYLYITKSKKKINKYINYISNYIYTSNEIKAVKNYFYSHAGKKISDSFYVYPQ